MSSVFDWKLVSIEYCDICGEDVCQEEWTKGKKKIITRDCQPESFDKLPKKLLKAMKGFE